MINITIPGAKNSSLPILCAVLLTKGIYIISNIPNITDIQNLFNLLRQFNVKIDYNNNIAHINTLSLKIPDKINYDKDFRGSYYLIGSIYYLIQTSYNFKISNGCNIDNRKINYHIDILEKMGTVCNFTGNNLRITKKKINLTSFYYTLDKPSIGATINFILLNVKSNRTSFLYNFAKDPYVYDLINFLNKMGSKIILKNNIIKIIGITDLKSTDHKIIYDPIIMGTYILLGGLLDYKYNIKLYIFPIIDTILGDFYKLLPILGIKLFKTDNDHYYIKYTKNIGCKSVNNLGK